MENWSGHVGQGERGERRVGRDTILIRFLLHRLALLCHTSRPSRSGCYLHIDQLPMQRGPATDTPLHCFDAFVRETQITLLSELRWCGPDVGYCPQHSGGKTRLCGGLRHPRDPHQRPLYLLSSPSFFPLLNLPTSTIAVSHPRLSRLSENCVCLPEERRRAEDVVPRRHLAFGSGSSGVGGG